MNKPASVRRKETVDSMAEIINNSGLPMFVIVPILKDMLEQATALANEEYKQELAQYESAIEEGGNDIAGN